MKGKIICLMGAQWGDEGKGRIVDSIGSDIGLFARYQGGANAGHTVIVDDKKYVFHLLPSGMLYAGKTCVIGSGVVFDPEVFFAEMGDLIEQGMDRARLVISRGAHVVMPYHKRLDELQEAAREKAGNKIGTTGRGIGPCYADKVTRQGLRVVDLLDEEILRAKLEATLEDKNTLFTRVYGEAPMAFEGLYQKALEWGRKLKGYLADASLEVHEALQKGQTVLLEGAQGALLDLDHGTYPMVTSSTTLCLGGLTSLGVGVPSEVSVMAVAKAYCTRVGEGAFPTEDFGPDGDLLRQKGGEFGATTGRPRRCGWFDMVAMNYALRIGGATEVVITKLDVLTGFDEIKVCVAYENEEGERVRDFCSSDAVLRKMKPIYRTFPGWHQDLSSARSFEDLPQAAREYLTYLSEEMGLPITMVGVGPEREQLIRLEGLQK